MDIKTICGIYNGEFWIAQYNEFNLSTVAKTQAYRNNEYTSEVYTLLTAYGLSTDSIRNDTPIGVVSIILAIERVSEHLNQQSVLNNLFNDDTSRSD